MYEYEEDYESLAAQYLDTNSLMYKKMRIMDSYTSMGNSLLDIGMGTGELIEREKHKFKKVYGIDPNNESIEICRRRFQKEENVTLLQCGIDELEHCFKFGQFNYITCLDV
jgi:ubiquinone/menaquinone biosynthesis C-methylase UbiE